MRITLQFGTVGSKGFRTNTGTNRPQLGGLSTEIRKGIETELVRRTSKATKTAAFRLASAMHRAANKELRALVRLVTNEMIGVKSNPGTPTEFTERHLLSGLGHAFDNVSGISRAGFTHLSLVRAGKIPPPPPGRIVWKALTTRGKRRFTNRGTTGHNKDRFFRDTDQLVQTLRSTLLDALISRAGGVRVFVERSYDVPRGTFVKATQAFASISVRIFPSLTGHHLKALTTGRWSDFNRHALLERFLFGEGDTFIKLRGPKVPYHIHRPLLQPVMSFFMIYRIPRVLSLAARQANLSRRHSAALEV